MSRHYALHLHQTEVPPLNNLFSSGALTFMVLAAALVTASFLMSPVIEDVFGKCRKHDLGMHEKYMFSSVRLTESGGGGALCHTPIRPHCNHEQQNVFSTTAY